MDIDLDLFCDRCQNTCCDNIVWFIVKDGKKIRLTGILLNHPDLNGIRLVNRPDGSHRCMELNQKTNKCTRYGTRPYICRDYHCNVLQCLGFNHDNWSNIDDIYLDKITKKKYIIPYDYRNYILNLIGGS